MWVRKLLISPVKKRDFSPKATELGPKLAVLVILAQAMQAYSVPCWWVGCWLWRAGCISQDTYSFYVFALKCYSPQNTQKIFPFFPHLGDHLVNLVMEWQTDSAESAVFFSVERRMIN